MIWRRIHKPFWVTVVVGILFWLFLGSIYFPIPFGVNSVSAAFTAVNYLEALRARDVAAARSFLFGEPDEVNPVSMQALLEREGIKFDRIEIEQVSCQPHSLCRTIRVRLWLHHNSGVQPQKWDVYVARVDPTWKIVYYHLYATPRP